MIEIDLNRLIHIPLKDLPVDKVGGWTMWYNTKSAKGYFCFDTPIHRYVIYLNTNGCMGMRMSIRMSIRRPVVLRGRELLRSGHPRFEFHQSFWREDFTGEWDCHDRRICLCPYKTIHQCLLGILLDNALDPRK